jgi:hypothetical protein
MQHLLDLYEMWTTGLEILERFDKNSPMYSERKGQLTGALILLGYVLEKDYSDHSYVVEINQLPKNPTDIKE